MLATMPARAGELVLPSEALAQAQAHSIILVDVRTPAEWADTGIPAGARTVSWGLSDFAERMLKVAEGDKHAPLVLICRTGNRSGRAMAFLREHGFTQVSHVAEGMAGSATGPGWLARGLPVQAWQAN